MAKNKKIERIYPSEVLTPVESHLKSKLKNLEKKKTDLEAEDPFTDKSRLDDNAAIDTDAAETVGHMEVSAVKKMVSLSMIQIRKALTTIRLGNYGLCERCGKMIDTDRLMVMPETTICVSCEKKKEK